MPFPKNFLWGGDISATQIEGGWNEGGKSPTETDYMLPGNKTSMRYAWYQMPDGTEGKMMQFSGQLPKGAHFVLKDGQFYPNHKATDFYHHYKEDIGLLGGRWASRHSTSRCRGRASCPTAQPEV